MQDAHMHVHVSFKSNLRHRREHDREKRRNETPEQKAARLERKIVLVELRDDKLEFRNQAE